MKQFTPYIFLLILYLLPAFSASGQVADFTVLPASGCGPLLVTFSNTSSGASSYKWIFGNGDSSIYSGTVSTTYLTAGTYTVKLIAYSTSGASSVHTETITVYPSPTVSFVASDTGVCPGELITFSSTGSAGVSGPATYSWNFGDGSGSSSASPTHTFTTPGYKNITLTVTNNKGCVATLVKEEYINVYTPPAADFSASATYLCNPPESTSFTSTVSGPGPVSYLWAFGDGGTSTDANPTYAYSSTGDYTVKLTVTDGQGCTYTITKPAYIIVGHLTGSFTAPVSGCANSPVSFENTTGGTVAGSSWTFSDGGSSGASSPSYTFAAAGTYTVTLIVSNGYCLDTVSHVITINPQPIVSFSVSPTDPCPAPVTESFSSTSPSGSSVSWKFGDGAIGSGGTATHTYSINGIDTVQMTVTNTEGCKVTVVKTDTIYNLTPEIDVDRDSGCVPLTVSFSASANSVMPPVGKIPYPYAITSYSWSFGDGSPTVTGATPAHTFTAAGVYTVTMTVITANGCEGTATYVIKAGFLPDPSFTVASICADKYAVFTNTTPGLDSFSYAWNFGDKSADSIPNPSPHKYMYPDTGYMIKLYANYNGCTDSFTTYVTVDSPLAVMSIKYSCMPDNQVYFMDSSFGDNVHEWFFGDGTTSAAGNTVHDYSALTTYTVTLTTYNTLSGCRDTTDTVINLAKPVPYFYASDSDICKGGTITFTSSIIGGEAEEYLWYVNGVLQPAEESTLSYTFTNTGTYPVQLVIMDQNHCYDTFSKTGYIVVANPIDSFILSSSGGSCGPLHEKFTDHSSDVAGVTLTNFTWYFGDGSSESVSTDTAEHTYLSPGTFSVEEIITDNFGCKDTMTLPAAIIVDGPTAAFSASNTHPCTSGVPIIFTNLSTGSIISSFWMFGDDSTSSEHSPTHSYDNPGTYTVDLVVTDTDGCTDTAKSVEYIGGGSSVSASFYMPDSVTICLPFTVDFINTTTDAVSYKWFFGDDNTSVLTSPSDIYTANGVYTVVLVATNSEGCVDTAIGHVVLFGGSGGFSYGPLAGCAPLTVNFGAAISNIPNIVWDFADGNTQTSTYSDSATHTYTIPGAYVPKLILSDNTGCEQSSQGLDTIKVDAVIAGFTTVPNPVCTNATFLFKDTSMGYFAPIILQRWTFAPGDTSNLSDPSYNYHDTGTFSINLYVADSLGCKDSITQNVTVYQPPVITISPDTTICVGNTAQLTGYGGVSYTWAPDASVNCSPCTTTNVSPDIVTQYTVTGTDIHGCQNTDTTTVFLRTATISIGWGDTAICLGDAVPLFDTGGTRYVWIPSEGLSDPNIAYPIATPSATTTYEVISKLADCMADTNYVKIIVHPLPTVDAGSDQYLVTGSKAQLQAVGTLIQNYAWTPAISLNCDSCSNPVATMTTTTTYTVQATSSFGCKSSDSVTIHLVCDKSQVFIPNSFTPNGDGQNDVFYPRGSGISLIKSFRIYNRWGELLFERSGIQINDVANAWDGGYNGETPKPDVYVYIIDAVCDTGEPIDLKGDVTIIR